jgi:hypothetical protein
VEGGGVPIGEREPKGDAVSGCDGEKTKKGKEGKDRKGVYIK